MGSSSSFVSMQRFVPSSPSHRELGFVRIRLMGGCRRIMLYATHNNTLVGVIIYNECYDFIERSILNMIFISIINKNTTHDYVAFLLSVFDTSVSSSPSL
jgi:hypothetical protein